MALFGFLTRRQLLREVGTATAAVGAGIGVPTAVALTAPVSSLERIRHHIAGLQVAMDDYYRERGVPGEFYGVSVIEYDTRFTYFPAAFSDDEA